MRAGIVAWLTGLALLLGGCDTTDTRYFRYGIGTDLYSEDIVQTTQYQDLYLTELCRQALSLVVTSEADCLNARLQQNDWDLIVQAGLNDIDRRCDSYLAWLDDRRRTNTAVLKQIGDTLFAAQGLMRLSGVGADPITMAGLAFGLATNTFTNVNSRLLLEVDKTTVQTLVLRRRGDYRLQLQDVRVVNKPGVIHALRSYLNICTPFTIETDINSTITVFQQAGAGALDRKGPLVSPMTAGAPIRATQTIVKPGRPDIVLPPPEFASLFEENLSKTEAERTLNALCFNKISPNILGADSQGRKALASFLAKVYQEDQKFVLGAKLTRIDRETITKQTDCGIAQNYYERKTFANTTTVQAAKISAGALPKFIKLLNRSKVGAQIDATATLAATRKKIEDVRTDPLVAAKLTFDVPKEFKSQVTSDLPDALANLPQN